MGNFLFINILGPALCILIQPGDIHVKTTRVSNIKLLNFCYIH
ncbi:hypothetical protein GLYMA_09G254951v4 [Glycine max]|nr:hypothetical protein GLYMA_09G254951v4 [Glycine max]KAH1044772.1 hypothetical protein GYH30_026164 [Glycine max]